MCLSIFGTKYISVTQYCLAIACFALHLAWCTLFLALFDVNLCENIALTLPSSFPTSFPPSFPPSLPPSVPPSLPPSLPSSLYFFTLDSSSSFDSEKESLGADVEDEEEEEEEEQEMMVMMMMLIGSALDGMAPTPNWRKLAN